MKDEAAEMVIQKKGLEKKIDELEQKITEGETTLKD